MFEKEAENMQIGFGEQARLHKRDMKAEDKHWGDLSEETTLPKWHKVADGDLPNNYRYVWTNVGAGYYDSSDHCWRDDFGRLQNVTAWCEPKFEE